jgi:hypothetical protein
MKREKEGNREEADDGIRRMFFSEASSKLLRSSERSNESPWMKHVDAARSASAGGTGDGGSVGSTCLSREEMASSSLRAFTNML